MRRAFKVHEKNYGPSYNVEVITEILVRLQNKDISKGFNIGDKVMYENQEAEIMKINVSGMVQIEITYPTNVHLVQRQKDHRAIKDDSGTSTYYFSDR